MKKFLIILNALFLLSCNQTKIDKKAEGEKVMQSSREWSRAASTGDIEKTIGYWADNAVVMSAGQPSINGKQAIRQMVEESYKMPGFRISWQPQSVDVSESGDMAYIMANSQISFADSSGKPITIHTKGVEIWRKQVDGSSKNVVDISTPEPVQSR